MNMETGPLPLTGQAWLLASFDFAFDEDTDTEELLAADAETPLLLIAEEFRDDPLELHRAFCVGIVDLFLQRYGLVNLVQGIRAWDRIVADMQTGHDMAAD
jgi:hypothetical protein